MAALRHVRTRVVLLRTDIREFINRKQRGSVRESPTVTDWDKWEVLSPLKYTHTHTYAPPPLFLSPLHFAAGKAAFLTTKPTSSHPRWGSYQASETWSGAANGASEVPPVWKSIRDQYPWLPCLHVHTAHRDVAHWRASDIVSCDIL